MNRSVAATCLAALLLLLPRAATALTVTQASIKVDPKKTDTAKFSGTLTAFGLRSTDDVTVTIDGVSYRVAHADLKQKVAKFTFHDKTKRPGIASLTLDLRRQRFSVSLKKIVLGSLRSPVRLEISGQVTECASVPLATSAKHPAARRRRPDLH